MSGQMVLDSSNARLLLWVIHRVELFTLSIFDSLFINSYRQTSRGLYFAAVFVGVRLLVYPVIQTMTISSPSQAKP